MRAILITWLVLASINGVFTIGQLLFSDYPRTMVVKNPGQDMVRLLISIGTIIWISITL